MRRVSALKKSTSSVLWLATSTRREGTPWEQVFFAGVAGVSMIFAALVAFEESGRIFSSRLRGCLEIQEL